MAACDVVALSLSSLSSLRRRRCRHCDVIVVAVCVVIVVMMVVVVVTVAVFGTLLTFTRGRQEKSVRAAINAAAQAHTRLDFRTECSCACQDLFQTTAFPCHTLLRELRATVQRRRCRLL